MFNRQLRIRTVETGGGSRFLKYIINGRNTIETVVRPFLYDCCRETIK